MSIDNDNIQDEITGYIDKGGDEDTVVPGGSSPDYLALPDEAPKAEVIQQVVNDIARALQTERDFYTDIKKHAIRVTTNLSGQVLFSRWSLTAQAIQIVREKDLRGDITIVNFGSDPAYVGLHAGIILGGTDTCRINAGAARTIRTRNALWAITGSTLGTAVEIDVQEEFD